MFWLTQNSQGTNIFFPSALFNSRIYHSSFKIQGFCNYFKKLCSRMYKCYSPSRYPDTLRGYKFDLRTSITTLTGIFLWQMDLYSDSDIVCTLNIILKTGNYPENSILPWKLYIILKTGYYPENLILQCIAMAKSE